MATDPTGRKPSMPVAFAMIGSELVGFTVVGVLIDWQAGTLKTFPAATLGLTILGFVVAMWHLIRAVRTPPRGPTGGE